MTLAISFVFKERLYLCTFDYLRTKKPNNKKHEMTNNYNENTEKHKEKRFKINEDPKEIRRALSEQGFEVAPCDTAVPFFSNGIPAGMPVDCGDQNGDFTMIPSFMAQRENAEFPVHGESMIGLGVEEGDIIHISCVAYVDEGDVVLAYTDDGFTLKVYHEDVLHNRWLVPMNPKFNPINMSADPKSRIVGRAMLITKVIRRASYGDIEERMKDFSMKKIVPPTDGQVREAINLVMPMLAVKRRWYSVYRALVDRGYVKYCDYDGFIASIERLYPDKDFGIDKKELQRMAVGAFDKPVSLWTPSDAPVTGNAYKGYYSVASVVLQTLRTKKQ